MGLKFQMRILARDGGSPPRTATAIATITVQRNINSPVFEAQFYNVTILETLNLLIPFIQVKASDNDIRVSSIDRFNSLTNGLQMHFI